MPTTDTLDGTTGVVDHYERMAAPAPGETPAETFHRLVERLLRYDVFPHRIMLARVCSDDGRVHEGTTIVQRVRVGPFRLESAVRVLRIWRREDADGEEVGFSYATLQGHPERGVSTFRVQRFAAGAISFVIEARSRAGSPLTRFARPLARRFQLSATEAAMSHVTGSPT